MTGLNDPGPDPAPTRDARDEPTVLTEIMNVMAASHRQGQAFARGDRTEARAAYREALASLGRLLVLIGEEDPRPHDQEPGDG